MERIPNGRYTKESREEAVKMARKEAYQRWRYQGVYLYQSQRWNAG